jgi:phosphoglycerate kinase
MNIRKLSDLKDLRGKRVFLRVDFNVPLENNEDTMAISDDTRIRAALDTICYLMSQETKVIICSHLGRPRGIDSKLSLKPIASHLSSLLGCPVGFINDCVGETVERATHEVSPGSLLLLENLRFYEGEEKNSEDFVRLLSKLADVYVNDAFGCAHRAHASTYGVALKFNEDDRAAGFLMEKELTVLMPIVSNEQPHPFGKLFIVTDNSSLDY